MSARLLVTPGDPRGVGPEVTLSALTLLRERQPTADVRVIGPDGALGPDDVAALRDAHPGVEHDPFGADPIAGRFAARSIERAVRMAGDGEAEAVVTAPLHKPSLHAAGWNVPGQTEMLAELTSSANVGMLMAAESTRLGGPLRVLLATTHLALREVAGTLTPDLLVTQCELLDRSLRRDWGLASPRIGVCALNPHASDGGLFGDEEERVYGPALETLRARGISATGPLPADTVFSRALAGSFDAVLAPYHDVGMAAFKTVTFGSGVNVTLGLPFIRTSPDHGTAFDIAGTGTADPSSMLEAMMLALHLANTRFDTPSADV